MTMAIRELLLATQEPVGIGAIVGLLSGVLTLLGIIVRYLRKGWNAIDTVLEKIDATAVKVQQLEQQMRYMNEHGTSVSQEIQRKLNTGEAKAQRVNSEGESVA